jgi:hypothetical protein
MISSVINPFSNNDDIKGDTGAIPIIPSAGIGWLKFEYARN